MGAEPLFIPRKLGPYMLGRKLGSGGMASVFAARQDASHVKRLVALKVLSAAISKDDPEHRSFMREALVATRLEHPNIVRTYDVGEIDGVMFLAMELVHGVALNQLIRAAAGPVAPEIVMRIVCDIARALQAAHDLVDPEKGHLGVVHQDVSPQNVLVGYDGVVKLVDFGVARFGSLEGSRTESLKGKPSYVSPEQIAGKHIDRRTDVFALGVIAWELLTGERLFKRETAAATYLAVLQDPIKPAREVNPKVPEPISLALARALEREKDKRLATADELRVALTTARTQAGLPDVSQEEIGAWAAKLVKPTVGPAELEREIVKEANNTAQIPITPRMQSSAEVMAAKPVVSPVADEAVPDLDLRAPPPKAAPKPIAIPKAPPPNPDATTVPPPKSRPSLPNAQPSRPSAPSHAGQNAISLDPSSDDDDMDMHIDRGLHVGGMQSAPSGARGSHHSSPSMPRPRSTVASTGLELAAERSDLRADDRAYGPSMLGIAGGFVLAAAAFGGAVYGLVRVAHRPSGLSVTQVLPHAFDGTSVAEAGVVAITALVGAVAMGYAGVKVRPRSWSLVGGAAAMFLAAIAMVTVALGSGGEDTTIPAGVLVMPYLLPVAVLGVGLGVAGRGAVAFRSRSIVRKLSTIPLAALGGALAFLAFEISAFVSRLH